MNKHHLLLLSAIALCAPGMLGASCLHTPTHVEQGQLFTTGKAEYDQFFKEVHDLREEAAKVEEEKAAAKAPLLKMLALDAKAEDEAAVAAAQERAKKLQESGLRLHLELTPEPKVIALKAGGGDDAEALMKAVEEGARDSLKLSRRLSAWPERIGALEKRRADLAARCEEAFKAERPIRRSEIERELEAAKDVIGDAGEAAQKFAGLASKFVIDLAAAVETGGGTAPPAPPAATAAAKAPPRWKGGPPKGWRPPAGAGTGAGTPPPPPKPKPAGGDDFEP